MTSEDKRPKPESLEAKFKLLQLLPYDARAKRKHCLVFGFILDWYHSKYGDALASVRHIVSTTKDRDPSGKGLYAGDVHQALTDLVSWGYLNQEKGIGSRASRYVPIWEKLSSVHKIPNTTDYEISVRENTNTCVRENTNTTAVSVRDSMNKDPSTSTRVPDPETRVDGNVHVPPVAALTGAPANTQIKSPFDELWFAYGVKKNRVEAESEYAKLELDDERQAVLVSSATAWREAWEAQGKPDAPRRHLHVWIRDRRYMEDPPTGYAKKERIPKPANSNRPSTTVQAAEPREEEITATLEVVTTASDEGVDYMDMYFDDESGLECHEIVLQSPNEAEQLRGQQELQKLILSLGIIVDDDTDPGDWDGMKVRVLRKGKRVIEWLPKMGLAA
ncbi:hypothetical protein [Phyllobacterium sp.]|nr:hypothetical protein [Phyllobacterium sp.]